MSRRVAVLASGRGSNLQALIDAAAAADYPADIALVLCNRPGAACLDRAKSAGLATSLIDHAAFAEREAFEREMDGALREAGVDLVCLAGFMRVLSPWLVGRWAGRMLNIHPSLLPSFRGLDTHARALEAGVRIHGCTVHFVSEGVDEGAIIGQAATPVLADDDEASLAARVLAAEHRLYPACLKLVAEERVRLGADGRAEGPGVALF